MANTANRNYPKPGPASQKLKDALLPFQQAFDAIDTDVAAAFVQLAGKAATVHTHAQSDITGLVAALAGKSATTHNHTLGSLTGVVFTSLTTGQVLVYNGTNWINQAPSIALGAHSHAQSDVTGLVAALAAKAPLASPAFTGEISLAHTAPFLRWSATGQGTDEKNWDIGAAGTQFYGRLVNDAIGSVTTWLQVGRSGMTASALQWTATLVQLNSNNLRFNGSGGQSTIDSNQQTVAMIRKASGNFLWFQNATGLSGGGSQVQLAALNDAGDFSIAGSLFATQAYVQGAAGTARSINFRTVNSARWVIAANATAESGSNAGSDLAVSRYSDAGAFIDSPFSISRATGIATFATTPKVGANDIYHAGNINVPFTKEYTSGLQTIVNAGGLTLAHGLGVRPKMVVGEIQCTVAESGYSVGDIVPVSMYPDLYSGSLGIGLFLDATNVNARFSATSSCFGLTHKTTGVTGWATNSNWQLRIRAFA